MLLVEHTNTPELAPGHCSPGQAAGKAKGGDVLTPVLSREQHLPWWLCGEKDGPWVC